VTGARSTPLGKTDVLVSPIGVGAGAWAQARWGYGATYGDREITEAYQASIDAGLTLFDTAEVYGDGGSERLLGALARGARVVLATKISPARAFFQRRLTHASFRRALAASLQRLGTDRIDLYQVHQPSWAPSIRSLMEWMADAVRDGQIRAVGVCNYDAEQMRRAHEALGARGVPLASNQVEYSVLARAPERNGVLAACRELGVTLIAHSPLARGLLSGRYRPDAPPSDPRPMAPGELAARLRDVEPLCRVLAGIGERRGGKSVAQVALNWLLQQPGVVPIPGAKNAAQARANAGALGWSLSREDMDAVDEATLRCR